MHHVLRPGLSFCRIADVALFLDLPRDRYFRLPDRLNAAFLALVAGTLPDDAALGLLGSARVIVPGDVPLPFQPVDYTLPVESSPAISRGPFRLGDVARVIATQHRVERRLGKSALIDVLDDVCRRRNGCVATELAGEGGAARAVRAFEFARLLHSAANRCLPRSIALALCLAREGVRAEVVLAVKLAPFAAHCWAQTGDAVLNDTPEEVARYTPILVV